MVHPHHPHLHAAHQCSDGSGDGSSASGATLMLPDALATLTLVGMAVGWRFELI